MDGVLLYTCCPLSHPHSTVRFLMNDLPLYFALTFITILSPGAGVLFTVTSALRSGFQDAWQAPLGNVLASACVAVACAADIDCLTARLQHRAGTLCSGTPLSGLAQLACTG